MAFNGDGPHTKRQRTETDSANNRVSHFRGREGAPSAPPARYRLGLRWTARKLSPEECARSGGCRCPVQPPTRPRAGPASGAAATSIVLVWGRSHLRPNKPKLIGPRNNRIDWVVLRSRLGPSLSVFRWLFVHLSDGRFSKFAAWMGKCRPMTQQGQPDAVQRGSTISFWQFDRVLTSNVTGSLSWHQTTRTCSWLNQRIFGGAPNTCQI
jgi:hypothetical protein